MFNKTLIACSVSLLISCGGSDNSSNSNDNQNNTPSLEHAFNRLATLPVCTQIEANCNTNTETAAEIVAVSGDNNTLVYTDSPNNSVGFIDIQNASSPAALGTLALAGEPTSVAVKNAMALVAINTSDDFINTSGQLDIIDINTRDVLYSLDLGGQPDSIALSPDGNYAVVAIENERDEDLGDGTPPQAPEGFVVIVNTQNADPTQWQAQTLELDSINSLYATDPEPEYVDINSNNIAVVTLQENNHIVLIDLATASIIRDFSAGSVDLTNIDTHEESPAKITLNQSLDSVLREPDGVSWIDNNHFATANEGDLDGGSRGFSIFNLQGDAVWDAGNTLDHLAVQYGHYPDDRSGNKGNEPENIEFAVFNNTPYLFVNSERSSLTFVYDVSNPQSPVYKQALPTAAAPEGGLAIADRNLLIVASEEDNRDDKLRSAINIYQYSPGMPNYPTLESQRDQDNIPTSWGALSGLAAHATDANILYAADDSFFGSNRIFTINTQNQPAVITSALTLTDPNSIIANQAANTQLDTNLVNAQTNSDNSVNLDIEGIDVASDGGFWIATEGAGTQGDTDRPVESVNAIYKVSPDGVLEQAIALPDNVNSLQVRFGLEGISEYNGSLYVVFQRAWGNEDQPRIGIYNIAEQNWRFVFYPLDAAASQNGGWVGLSDIASLGEGRFAIIERDNQAGPDAAIKKLYSVNLQDAQDNTTITKTLLKDLMPSINATGALTYEKIEGVALNANNMLYIINDNDGVDDNSGETQLLNIGNL